MDPVKIYRKITQLSHFNMFYFDTQTNLPVILSLHGRWGRAEVWADFINHYGQNYRIIAPDQRGHGLSGKPIGQYTAEEMANDIIELLDYLQIKSVILVGHSMGGRIAGYITALYPSYVRGLAILDKSPRGNANLSYLSVDQISPIDPFINNWPIPFSSLYEAMKYIKKATESELSYQYFMNSLIETIDGYSMMFSAQAIAANIANDREWWHLLPKITCPVILIRASNHEAVTDEDLSRMHMLLPQSLTYEMSNPDHNVHQSNKDEFYAYFDRFLTKCQR